MNNFKRLLERQLNEMGARQAFMIVKGGEKDVKDAFKAVKKGEYTKKVIEYEEDHMEDIGVWKNFKTFKFITPPKPLKTNTSAFRWMFDQMTVEDDSWDQPEWSATEAWAAPVGKDKYIIMGIGN